MEVDQLLRKFWELESYLPDHKALTPEDKNCEIYYETTHTRQTDGKYIVCLPFKDGFKERLGDSKSIAVKRLLQVENKFKKNIKFKEDYCKFMNQYLSDGHMELVPEKEINNKEKYYLPHHAVLREASVSTKLRVVFDGSAKPLIGNSLNEELLIGPSLQQDIRDLITRWRQHKYCLVADIQKMYRCIKCRESDTDYQRILWRENNNEPIKEYRLLTVTYGTSCAPYLAIRTLHQLCDDEIHSYPEVAPLLKTDVFVDDLLSGDATEEGAIHLQKQLTDIFLSGGFPLHKWCSNSELVLNNIPDNQKVYHSSVNIKIDNSVKALGITWEPNSDNFKLSIVFDNVINSNNLTKRKVLSTIASIFDPLGWLAPIVIVFKIFMQKLWLTGLGWDDELNSDLTKEWSKHVNNIAQHNTFFLPRWLSTSSSNTKVELHGFSDSSCDAYAAVIYIRVFNSHEVTTQLIMSKTKVAPVKQISIPRLELCGAVLLANMLKNVQTSLKIKNDAVFAWTDSTIVLSWLQKHPNSWKTFIANRTAEILNLYSNHQWFHIKSSENPADCASRGLDSCDLVNHHLWWKGPEFLYKSDKSNFETFVVPDTCLEAKSKVCNLSVNSDHDCLSFLNKYSSLTKLIRVIAYCKRFITSCRSKLTTIYLSSHELKVAFNICIKLSQQYYFSSEISLLLKHKVIPKSSKLHSLCPVLDSDNILRVGGRLINANISLDMKTPVILSYQCNLSKLIVKNSHLNSLHGGIQLTLNLIRRKFWIISCKNLIKKVINQCIPCYKQRATSVTPFMGNLPLFRVNPARAFRTSGVDYAGPVSLKLYSGKCNRTCKAYICLFICTVTKAIHLELVSDLTSSAFIAAFRRFTARRGHCQDLWSDCGTNFVGASRELNVAFKNSKSNVSKEISELLANNNTNWHFIPPGSPHFGGLWEAGVKSVKGHITRTIGQTCLTFEEYSTLLAQVEACVNSRPLTLISTSLDDSPLTPGHFLVGEPLLHVPEETLEDTNLNYLDRWNKIQKLVQSIWHRWQSEYLTTLQHRYKWSKSQKQINLDTICLIKDDRLPPCKWQLGRVIATHPGSDGVIRVVTLKIKGGHTLKRAVAKLCPLPLDGD